MTRLISGKLIWTVCFKQLHLAVRGAFVTVNQCHRGNCQKRAHIYINVHSYIVWVKYITNERKQPLQNKTWSTLKTNHLKVKAVRQKMSSVLGDLTSSLQRGTPISQGKEENKWVLLCLFLDSLIICFIIIPDQDDLQQFYSQQPDHCVKS